MCELDSSAVVQDQCGAVVNIVMSLQVPLNEESFFTG